MCRFAACAVAVALMLASATIAAAATDEQKCSASLIKEAGKYAKARTKILGKCNDALLKAKDGFNDVQGAGCRSLDGKTQEQLAKASSKLEAAVDKSCGGSGNTCQDGDALDLDDPAIGWGPSGGFGGTCPGFESEVACRFTIDDCGGAGSSGSGVSDCLLCINDAAVDQAMDLLYGDLDAANFGAIDDPAKTRNKCQQAFVKSASKFLLSKSQTLGKCWAALDQAKAGFSSSHALGCIDSSGTTAAKIAKAESKKIAGICNKCGGAGKRCEQTIGPVTGDGLADDLDPQTEIGFGTACPVAILPYPPGTDCSTLDDLPSGSTNDVIDSLEELVRCIDCVLEYKVDCIDRAAVPHHQGLPMPCAATPTITATPTVTITPTPTLTATPTLTPSPTPTVTSTPGPDCGNNILDAGEECDLLQGPCPGQCAGVALGGDACTCPVGSFDLSAQSDADLDTGWTGIGHDQAALDGFLFPSDLYGCSSGGPDTSCTFIVRYLSQYFGAPLPLSTGGVPVCVVNDIFGEATGGLDLTSGAFNYNYRLISRVHTGLSPSQPCPTCVGDPVTDDDVLGGTCNGGPSNGAACDADAQSPVFGAMSFDCLPDPIGNIGNLDIIFDNATTGTKIETITAGSPSCTAAGFSSLQCFCDTCDNLQATPCRTHDDCIAVGATTCGGMRCGSPATNAGDPCTVPSQCLGGPCTKPGEPTKPNGCSSTVCTHVGDGEGECTTGPFGGLCTPQERFRGCNNDSDCPFPGDTCVFEARECFTSQVTRRGTEGLPSGTYAGTFCIPPTGASGVNSTAGLPGLGTILLPYTISNLTVVP
jgi:hypothetical protein